MSDAEDLRMVDQHARQRRKRTPEEAREALQRLINGCWSRPSAKACFSIPVDEERDADCIVSDVIHERDALLEEIAHLEREQAEDRAAIQHFVGKHHCRQCEIEHAAAIARAQEGKGT